MQKTDQNKKRGEKRYEPPRVIETATFETLALTCGKTISESACVMAGTVADS